jgi:hypothetical protein
MNEYLRYDSHNYQLEDTVHIHRTDIAQNSLNNMLHS